jgi:DNA-binding protein H-NS
LAAAAGTSPVPLQSGQTAGSRLFCVWLQRGKLAEILGFSPDDKRAEYYKAERIKGVEVLPMVDEDLDHCSPSIVGDTANKEKSSIDVGDLASMLIEELWTLRENIDAILAAKISAELNDLRRQLDRLSPKASSDRRSSSKAKVQKRRSYPSVLPKYQNPMRPFETWSGRGKQPRWLKEQLISGKSLEDFRIAAPEH